MSRHYDNWITGFLEYMDNSEAPTSYIIWTAISAVAAAMQRKCYLKWGLITFYPNMYIVLVGPPGGRKGTAMGPAKNILRTLKVPLAPSFATGPSLVKELVDKTANYANVHGQMVPHSSMTIMSEEMAVFFTDPDMEIKLTDLFDNPDQWEYVIKTGTSDYLDNVWVNLLGCITPSLLQDKITIDSVGSGFASRLIFVVEQGKRKRSAMPSAPVGGDEMLEKLTSDLERIKMLKGRFKFTADALRAYKIWYSNPEVDHAVSGGKFEGYNSRRAMHLLKLCMIVSAAKSDNMVVDVTEFNYALTLLEAAESKMSQAFQGVGRSENAAIMGDLLRYLQQRQSCTWVEILDTFKLDCDSDLLEKMLTTLKTIGRIKMNMAKDGKRHYQWIRGQ